MSETRSSRTHWFLLAGLLLAAVYWCSEAFLHSTAFHGGDFLMELWPSGNVHELWMRLFTVALFVISGTMVDNVIARLRRAHRGSAALVVELRRSLAEVQTLTGLLPICSVCKKIRDDTGYWQQVEMYIRDRSDLEFTHGYCPDCAAAARREFALVLETDDTARQHTSHQEPMR